MLFIMLMIQVFTKLESANKKIKSLGSDKKDSIEIKALNDKLLKAVIENGKQDAEMKELKNTRVQLYFILH